MSIKTRVGIFGLEARQDTCTGKHTPCPSDYVGWTLWAEKKAKTHKQKRCPVCGLWGIWMLRNAT